MGERLSTDSTGRIRNTFSHFQHVSSFFPLSLRYLFGQNNQDRLPLNYFQAVICLSVTRQPPAFQILTPPNSSFSSLNLFSLKILHPSQLTTCTEALILDVIIFNPTLISAVVSSEIVGTIDYRSTPVPSLSALTR